MNLTHFEMSFGEEAISINGTLVTPQQAVLVALHLLEHIGRHHTVTDLALAPKAHGSPPPLAPAAPDAASSTPHPSPS